MDLDSWLKNSLHSWTNLLKNLEEEKYKVKFKSTYLQIQFYQIKKSYKPQPVKTNLNKKLDSKQKTIQAFNIDTLRVQKN